MSKDMDRDEQALVQRDQGRSFVGIAGILELDSARAVNAAFNRALGGDRMPNRCGCAAASWRVLMPSPRACVGATTSVSRRSSVACVA